jgi:hypothetical protein
MAGVIKPIDAEPFYTRFYYKWSIIAIGSTQVDGPFASYVGLLGEAGLLGTGIYLVIYFKVYRKLKSCAHALRNDAGFYPLALSSLGFLIYSLVVAFYNSWLETGRMTTILWSMIAMVINHAQQTCGESPGRPNRNIMPTRQDGIRPAHL